MIITKHIAFFFIEKRIKYINTIINEANNYKYKTDIYIHTNYKFSKELLVKYTNGNINIICYNLQNINPFKLTWLCRYLLKQQINKYDIFMYIEDDILVKAETIEYWLKYSNLYSNLYTHGCVVPAVQ